MNTLVTGGFGFIGSHLVEELAVREPDTHIHVVDNLSTSTIDHKQFMRELDTDNVTFDIADMSDYLWESDTRYDQIYHLASIVGPAGVLPHSGNIAKAIIGDADAVVDRAKQWGARLVNVSTSELYGGGVSSEEDPKIISPHASARLEYAVGKLAAEIALINQAKTAGLDVVIVRPFNIAGARQSKLGGFVLPRFASAAIKNEPLTVFGDGSQVRAFTHAKDMVRGLQLAMAHGEAGEAYNIGDRYGKITIKELAQRVIALAGSDSWISYVDPTEIYGEHYVEANDKIPDVHKANEHLGWRPHRSLNDIINDALAWERGLQ